MLDKKIKDTNIGKIVTISGRYYAMDRDNRWDRVEASYKVLTEESPVREIKKYWKESQTKGITDEFIVPTSTCTGGLIEDNDGIIFFNFRWCCFG